MGLEERPFCHPLRNSETDNAGAARAVGCMGAFIGPGFATPTRAHTLPVMPEPQSIGPRVETSSHLRLIDCLVAAMKQGCRLVEVRKR